MTYDEPTTLELVELACELEEFLARGDARYVTVNTDTGERRAWTRWQVRTVLEKTRAELLERNNFPS